MRERGWDWELDWGYDPVLAVRLLRSNFEMKLKKKENEEKNEERSNLILFDCKMRWR